MKLTIVEKNLLSLLRHVQKEYQYIDPNTWEEKYIVLYEFV